MIFKFARDPNVGTAEKPRYLFGGGSHPDMEGAAKSLGQELKGQSGYYWAEVEGLCFPLMAVIDFIFKCFLVDHRPERFAKSF